MRKRGLQRAESLAKRSAADKFFQAEVDFFIRERRIPNNDFRKIQAYARFGLTKRAYIFIIIRK